MEGITLTSLCSSMMSFLESLGNVKCTLVNVLLVPMRLKADFTVGDGEGSDSSCSSHVASVEPQFDSSNMPTCWDGKTDLVLLLEVQLVNGLSELLVDPGKW